MRLGSQAELAARGRDSKKHSTTTSREHYAFAFLSWWFPITAQRVGYAKDRFLSPGEPADGLLAKYGLLVWSDLLNSIQQLNAVEHTLLRQKLDESLNDEHIRTGQFLERGSGVARLRVRRHGLTEIPIESMKSAVNVASTLLSRG